MKRPNVEPWLQANMAALVVCGSVALDLGQQTITKSLVTSACAVASLFLTDWFGIFRLHRALANLAALVALGYGVWDFASRYTTDIDPVRQLLSIANLLIYLQVILLFQKKDVRKYWLLAVLSLLEIVVASALWAHTNRPTYTSSLNCMSTAVSLTNVCPRHATRRVYRFPLRES